MGIVLLHSIFIHLGYNDALSNILRLVAIKTLLILSGFVVYGKINDKGWVAEKVIRRIPMLVIFTAVYWFVARYIAGIDGGERITGNLGNFYIYNVVTGFGITVLWYIWALIICYVILWAFERYFNFPKIPYSLKLLALAVLISLIPYDALGLKYVRWYGLFVIGGYWLKYLVVNYKQILKYEWASYFSLAIFPICVLIFRNVIDYSGQAINSGYVHLARAIGVGEIGYALIYTVLAITGALFVYCAAKLIVMVKISKPFVIVGGATIGILLLHKPLLEMKLADNYWVAMMIASAVSLVTYLVLKNIKVLNYAMFGGTDIPIKITERLEGWYGKTQEQG